MRYSIVICTHNGSPRLGSTLKHLAELDYPSKEIELLLIDNNSSDGTADYAGTQWKELGEPFRINILSEPRQGLSNARFRGCAEARAEYLVFCDDDNWLQPDYLRVADEVLLPNPEIGVLGGQGVPVTDAPAFPNWFYSYASGYAVGVQAMESGDISARGYVWGAGMILRRETLSAIYGLGIRSLLSDRSGADLGSGGDSEICKWLLASGYRLWFESALTFKHFIPAQRLTEAYLRGQWRGFEGAGVVLSCYDQLLRRRDLRRARGKHLALWVKAEIRGMLFWVAPDRRRVLRAFGRLQGLRRGRL